jgi:hypothetical protein
MTAEPGPTALRSEGAKRLVAEHVEQIVVVRHHLVFGMHVDPLSKGLNGDTDADQGAGPWRADDRADA